MFKNYLTYQFAQNFDRACRTAEVSASVKARLTSSSAKMLDHFKRSLEAESSSEGAKRLFVALLCLRDCKQVLEEAGLTVRDIDGPYAILHRRLEQLCAASFPADRNGQFRLFGAS